MEIISSREWKVTETRAWLLRRPRRFDLPKTAELNDLRKRRKKKSAVVHLSYFLCLFKSLASWSQSIYCWVRLPGSCSCSICLPPVQVDLGLQVSTICYHRAPYKWTWISITNSWLYLCLCFKGQKDEKKTKTTQLKPKIKARKEMWKM